MKNNYTLTLLFLLISLSLATAQINISSYQKISSTQGSFSDTLYDYSQFGSGIASLGDFDGDGVTDIIVGADGYSQGGTDKGAAFILFLNSNGTVKSSVKINQTNGGLNTGYNNVWGYQVANLGDVDGDGITDVAVGEPHANDNGSLTGAAWILFLNANGTVKGHQKISNSSGNLGTTNATGERFGAVSDLGDLNQDGVPDMAVGCFYDNEGGQYRGSVYILFLDSTGTVISHQKISSSTTGFTTALSNVDHFGTTVRNLGDFDGDGNNDLLVGSRRDDDGGSDRGAFYILYLNQNGTLKNYSKVSSLTSGFSGTLDNGDEFGMGAIPVGDWNGDSVPDIAVGSYLDDDGGTNRGGLYILYMNSNGTVSSHDKIGSLTANFTTALDDNDHFGWSIAHLGDINGDGKPDLAVGSFDDDDGGTNRGAIYLFNIGGEVVSSEGELAENEIAFYPNPVDETLFVNGLTANEKFQIDMMTIDGKSIFSATKNASGSGDLKIDVQQFPSGMYIIRLVSKHSMITTKLVID